MRTIDGLIRICGDRFGELRLYTNPHLRNRWSAKGANGIPAASAETPSEALELLLIELGKPEYIKMYKNR